jgi:hypothetical protein
LGFGSFGPGACSHLSNFLVRLCLFGSCCWFPMAGPWDPGHTCAWFLVCYSYSSECCPPLFAFWCSLDLLSPLSTSS